MRMHWRWRSGNQKNHQWWKMQEQSRGFGSQS